MASVAITTINNNNGIEQSKGKLFNKNIMNKIEKKKPNILYSLKVEEIIESFSDNFKREPIKYFSLSTENDEYTVNIVDLIVQTSSRNDTGLFSDIAKLIGAYEYNNDSTVEYYEKVMNRLEVPERDRKDLDFSKSDFALKLLALLKMKKEEIPKNDFFWCDLERLLFKWLIHMKKTFADDERLFETNIAAVKRIIVIIYQVAGLGIFDISHLLSNSINFKFSLFDSLLLHEVLDNPDAIKDFFRLIKGICDDNVSDGDGDKNNLKKEITCKDIENEYFNGSFDKDPLLKIMLTRLTPETIKRQLIEEKKCFSDTSLDFDSYHDFTASLLRFNNEKHAFKDVCLFETMNPNYMSKNTIKFFLKNKIRIPILTHNHLVRFLNQIDEMENLETVSIKEIFGFNKSSNSSNSSNVSLEWNEEKFKGYLEDAAEEYKMFKGKFGISQEKCIRYSGLVKSEK